MTWAVGDECICTLDRQPQNMGTVYVVEKVGAFTWPNSGVRFDPVPSATIRQVRGGQRQLKHSKRVAQTWLAMVPRAD